MNYKTVLIVEDERGPRESLRIILKNSFRIKTVSSGKEALQVLEKERFDLITIDLKLPDISGMELLRFLKTRFPGSEFMVITGYGGYENIVEIYEMGVTLILIKPFDVADLSEYVQQAFHRKKINARIAKFTGWLKTVTDKQKNQDLMLSDEILTELKKRIAGIEKMTGYYSNHGNNVWNIAQKFSEFLRLPDRDQYFLEIASYVHHLGKMGYCYPVYLAERQFNTAEQMMMKRYPVETTRLLKNCGIPETLENILLHCEEHHDGSGYPAGLKGDNIPFLAQVLHLCTLALSFHHDSCFWNKNACMGDLVDRINELAGTELSPKLADAFIELINGNQADSRLVHEKGFNFSI